MHALSHCESLPDIVPATLVIASRCLSFVAPHRLRALPLLDLCRILQSVLVDAFQGGAFLQELSASAITTVSTLVFCIALRMKSPTCICLQTESQFSRNVDKVAGGLLFAHMATLSAMYAQVISVLADCRVTDAWSAISEIMSTLDQLAATVEDGWSSNPLAGIDDENSLRMFSCLRVESDLILTV